MIQVSFIKKIASYFFPIKFRAGSSSENPVLELFLFKGQWQLATKDAVYSDGTRYQPMVAAFNLIESRLKNVEKVLMLGVGLGSAVEILDEMNYHPKITLVDIDELVLKWAKEFLGKDLKKETEFICKDAYAFIQNTNCSYDIIIVDIFKGRAIPEFVSTASFLAACKAKLSDKGIFILNYMIPSASEWEDYKNIFKEVFPENKILNIGINRVLVATI